MTVRIAVLDASVGVKLFRDEAGSNGVRAVVEAHSAGELTIAVDTLFMYEVIAALCAREGDQVARRAWEALQEANFVVLPLGDDLMKRAIDARGRARCSLYDATSIATAELLGATLYSADSRAHGAVPGVVLITE